MKKLFDFIKVCVLPCLLLSLQACRVHSEEDNNPDKDYLNFPKELSPVTPYDVDSVLERRLMNENNVDEANRLFDILSWQLFISLNWPRDAKGNPQSSIAGSGSLLWDNWKESYEIFLPDGSAPKPWGALASPPPGFKLAKSPGSKILHRASKMAAFKDRHTNPDDYADEMTQAFTSPIWDQNGNMVRYEIRVNKLTFDYIVNNELYNIDGQKIFYNAGKKVSFPISSRDKEGTIEMKVAWKVIDPVKDIAERFYTRDAYVLNLDSTYSKVKVGMVGMHISSRTQSSPEWVWATFEHVDNLETNPLKTVNGKRLKSSFYDPTCATCPVNLFPDTTQEIIKNQIQRVLPIPRATQELNKQVQKLFADKGSVWQYYELIGTQWSTQPGSPPYYTKQSPTDTVYTLPDAVTNKGGGKQVPAYLTNMIMETYFQGGTTIDSPSHYNQYLGNEPAYYQIQSFPNNYNIKNTRRMIFGTESCVGCHFSSAIAIGDSIDPVKGKIPKLADAGTGNYEWLIQLKAHYKKQK